MLKAQPHDIKVKLLKENGICFGCLTKGHMSKTCKRRMTCQLCQGKHPSILHINKPADNQPSYEIMNATKKSISGTLFSVDKEEDIGAGKDCKLSIVPVQIKSSKGNKTILTYAFLDPGSTATFCTENLM